MKTLRRLNSSRPVGPPAVLPDKHRIGREQRREHDDVAEDEDPEPVSDDDARRGRPAAAAPARELGRNRGRAVGRYRHAACLRPSRARSICATSAAEISCSRSSLQPNTRTATTAARRPRIAIHQICQISAKPVTTAKKAVMKPVGAVARHLDRLHRPARRRPAPPRAASSPRTRRSSRPWAAPRNCRPAAATRSPIPGFDRPTGRRSGRGGCSRVRMLT